MGHPDSWLQDNRTRTWECLCHSPAPARPQTRVHPLPPESSHGFLGRQASLANLQTPNHLLTDAHDTNLAGGATRSTCPFPGARSCQLQSAAGRGGGGGTLKGMVAISLHCHQTNARQGPFGKWIFHFNEHFGKLKRHGEAASLAMRKMLY